MSHQRLCRKTFYQQSGEHGGYVFEPQILDFIKGNGYLDFPDLVKQLLHIGQVVNYYPFDGYWLDIGRHDDYSKASEEFDQLQEQFHLLGKNQ